MTGARDAMYIIYIYIDIQPLEIHISFCYSQKVYKRQTYFLISFYYYYLMTKYILQYNFNFHI